MYETKVVLTSIARIISKSESLEEVYEAVLEMANVEGVILKPYSEVRAEYKKQQEEGK